MYLNINGYPAGTWHLFPESLPAHVSDTLAKVTVRHLLTMNCGHGKDPTGSIWSNEGDWVKAFLEWPIDYEPGTCYCYNSLGTYVFALCKVNQLAPPDRGPPDIGAKHGAARDIAVGDKGNFKHVSGPAQQEFAQLW